MNMRDVSKVFWRRLKEVQRLEAMLAKRRASLRRQNMQKDEQFLLRQMDAGQLEYGVMWTLHVNLIFGCALSKWHNCGEWVVIYSSVIPFFFQVRYVQCGGVFMIPPRHQVRAGSGSGKTMQEAGLHTTWKWPLPLRTATTGSRTALTWHRLVSATSSITRTWHRWVCYPGVLCDTEFQKTKILTEKLTMEKMEKKLNLRFILD